MPTHSVQVQSLHRRLLALLIVLWLGGLGCTLGWVKYGLGIFAAEAGSTRGAHACCRRMQATDCDALPRTVLTVRTGPMTCCPLAGQRAGLTSLKDLVDLLAPVTVRQPVISFVAALTISFLPVQPVRPPDRGGTYLRYCVWLI